MDYAPVFTLLMVVCAGTACGQQACPAVADIPLTPARTAYAHGNYKEAQEMYEGELILRPGDLKASAGLVQSLLHQGMSNEAVELAAKLVAREPTSAIALTAQAEVQLHLGELWLALETLVAADKTDPCYARIHYVRSRVLRLDSQYASERAEVAAAYQIDAKDPDIHRAWLSSAQPAHEIESIHESLATMKNIDPDTKRGAERSISESLATMKNIDPDTKRGAERSISEMMPLLSENNQTCKIVPKLLEIEVTLPLAASYEDAKHIGGYKLEVLRAQTKAHLTVDTAASGLFISRALAEANGLTASPEAPAGTVHVDSFTIGGLEFKDCIVGVSDAPFAGKAEGFIGTDVFAPWLIHFDQPGAKLTLSPLPAEAGVIPGDRPTGSAVPAALQGFSPVYHRQQYLLVPVTLSNKSKRLFVLDSGSRLSTMTSEAAHAVSATKVNFTNAVQTVGGRPIQVFRDAFDFQFASLSFPQQAHIVEFDPSNIEQSTGIRVAGLLGFDMLHTIDMWIDYRDGLVRFESATGGGAGPSHAQMNSAVAAVDCNPEDNGSQPLNTTMQAKVVGLMDSAHLKVGSKVTLKMATAWQDGTCELAQNSVLYGHVTEARSTSSPDTSELSLVFDAGDCLDKGKSVKRAIPLKIIGLIGPPDQFVGIQSAMPVKVAGGGRDISVAAQTIGSGFNQFSINLNPDGPPDTIKHGIVKGLPGVKLETRGGPGCSAKITGTGRSIHLGDGSQFILTP